MKVHLVLVQETFTKIMADKCILCGPLLSLPVSTPL